MVVEHRGKRGRAADPATECSAQVSEPCVCLCVLE